MSTLDQARDALRDGSPAEAVPLLQTHLHEHPDDRATLQLLAQASGRAGDWPQTEQVARRLTELEPEDARHWYVLGVAMRKQRRYTEAREAQGRALGMKADFAEALTELQKISGDEVGWSAEPPRPVQGWPDAPGATEVSMDARAREANAAVMTIGRIGWWWTALITPLAILLMVVCWRFWNPEMSFWAFLWQHISPTAGGGQ